MARLTLGQKAERVLKLLLGLRHAPVARALKAHGFGNADLAEGWRRLAQLTCTDVDAVPPPPSAQAAADAELLESWERRWLPLADASLRHRMPDAYAALFLTQRLPSGASMVLRMALFLEHFEALDGSQAQRGLGAAGAAAKQLLEQRGFVPTLIGQAKDTLARRMALGAEPELELLDDPARQSRAEEELWAWYLEWSAIARMAIRDKRLLRALDLLHGASGKAPQGGDEGALHVEASDEGQGD